MTAAKELTLQEWLSEYEDEITQLVEFSKAALPDDAGGLHNELSRAQQDIGRAGAFLADLEAYVTQAEAAATIDIRKTHGELTAGERRAMVKASIASVVRYRDGLKTVLHALRGKSFALMNLGRSQH